jgi:hypothetical protein
MPVFQRNILPPDGVFYASSNYILYNLEIHRDLFLISKILVQKYEEGEEVKFY